MSPLPYLFADHELRVIHHDAAGWPPVRVQQDGVVHTVGAGGRDRGDAAFHEPIIRTACLEKVSLRPRKLLAVVIHEGDLHDRPLLARKRIVRDVRRLDRGHDRRTGDIARAASLHDEPAQDASERPAWHLYSLYWRGSLAFCKVLTMSRK